MIDTVMEPCQHAPRASRVSITAVQGHYPFLRAYEAWERDGSPHIMVYFNQRSATPKTAADAEQWRQVLAFRERLPHGQKVEYRGKDNFERQIRHALTELFHHTGKRQGPN